ncbi:MAG: hypothetical protein M1840_004614 [Geoglossum simile]|nr:MAG: hypothetical protein M1840_004614 [Geoglossum simile]
MTTTKRRHGRSAGKPGQYQHECDICRSTFARAEHLSRHKRTVHSQEKRFRCDICGKSCSRSDNLRQHRKTHRQAPKDTDSQGEGDSEREIYPVDGESTETDSNWGGERTESSITRSIDIEMKDGATRPVTRNSNRAGAVAGDVVEQSTGQYRLASESGLVSTTIAQKPPTTGDVGLTVEDTDGDSEDNEMFKMRLNGILRWVWERFPPPALVGTGERS